MEKLQHELEYSIRFMASYSDSWDQGETAKIDLDRVLHLESVSSLGFDTEVIWYEISLYSYL